MKKLIETSLVLFVCLFPGTLSAQWSVEFNIGAGYTLIDLEKWYSNEPYDAVKVNGIASLQVWKEARSNFTFGGELSYHFLYWSEFQRYSYSTGTYYNETSEAPLGGQLLVRFQAGKTLFLDFAAGLYLFSSWVDPVVSGAIGFKIPLSESFYMPIRSRVHLILDSDALVVPIGGSVGLGYSFN